MRSLLNIMPLKPMILYEICLSVTHFNESKRHHATYARSISYAFEGRDPFSNTIVLQSFVDQSYCINSTLTRPFCMRLSSVAFLSPLRYVEIFDKSSSLEEAVAKRRQ